MGDDKESCFLSRTGDLEVCRASEVSRRASGIVVSEFFSFEGVMAECRIVDVEVDDNDDDDGGGVGLLLVRRAFVTAPASVGIERNLASLPREEVERDDLERDE